MTTPSHNLFVQARELPAAERDAFLQQACGDNPDLHLEVQRLLIEAERADSFFGNADGTTLGAEEFTDSYAEKEGDVVGSYKLRQPIGEGGFGSVWMAEQSVPISRMVAVKVIKAGMDTKQVLARFDAERQALAMMDHPNIAKVLDAGATASGRPWFAMELVKGIPITHYCDQAGLGTKERLVLFRDVCSAINHAHQKGIIHRDIKPSNVMVTQHGDKPVVKVIDFGIAKATQGKLTDQTLFTRVEQFIGTPVYMSPEQAGLSGLDIDTRSDIYALGILLYELLVGRPPFDSKSLVSAGYEEMRRIIREVEPPKPSSRLSTVVGDERSRLAKAHRIDPEKLSRLVEADLDWIVMKAIDKDRARRYETANGFAQDIARFLANEPVTAAAPGVAYRFRKFARRNKAALAVAALVFSVLVAATGISLWQANLARRAAAEAMEARNDANTKAAAERVAREQSEAIMKFFVGVFQNPDPTRDGRNVTVAETLDTAVITMKTELASQPDQRARLQRTIGLTYHSLDLAPEAIPLLEAARDYYRDALGAENPTTLLTMGELGFSYARAGRQSDALKLQEERVTLSRRIYSMKDPDMLAALGSLANAYAEIGRSDDALKLWEELLPAIRTVNGPKHRNTLAAMTNLAVSYDEVDRPGDALKMREEVLTMSREVHGEKHTDTLAAMNNLAVSYDKAGRTDHALELREDVLEGKLKRNGPKHTETLTAMTNLAISYGRGGDLDKALEMNQEVLTLRREVSGPQNPETLMAMVNLAITYGKYGNRMKEAIAMQEEALASMRRVLPPKHPYLLGAMQVMSALYWQDGRRDEAEILKAELEALAKPE